MLAQCPSLGRRKLISSVCHAPCLHLATGPVGLTILGADELTCFVRRGVYCPPLALLEWFLLDPMYSRKDMAGLIDLCCKGPL